MLNKSFYAEYIFNKYNHIIGGSTAVKKHISNFRESKDIDVMMSKSDIISLTTDPSGYEVIISKYGNNYYIASLVFPDESKIDLIDPLTNLSFYSVKEIDGVKFLSLEDICGFKLKLIDNSELNETIRNKHVKDLLFFIREGHIQLKEYNIAEEIPF